MAPVPKLTIICMSYNNGRFIREALESTVRQKTNFPFEVIVSDNCSTDDSVEIIKEFAAKYPDIIKPIYRSENIGMQKNWIDSFSRVKSQYALANDADDYFTDDYKLQKQVDFLDSHPDYSICFHDVLVKFEEETGKDYIFPKKKDRFYKTTLDLDDALRKYFLQVNSVMYRWRFPDGGLEEIFPSDMWSVDVYMHLLHAQAGKIGFLNGVMSVYRRHSGGIWWNSVANQEKLFLNHGMYIANYYHNVYGNITGFSTDYFNDSVLPYFRELIRIYLKYDKLKELEIISEKYPGYFHDAAQDLAKKENMKFIKYRKRAAALGTAAVFFCVAFIISLVIICVK